MRELCKQLPNFYLLYVNLKHGAGFASFAEIKLLRLPRGRRKLDARILVDVALSCFQRLLAGEYVLYSRYPAIGGSFGISTRLWAVIMESGGVPYAGCGYGVTDLDTYIRGR